MLNEKEIEFLANAISLQKNDYRFNKGGRFKDPGKSYQLFAKTSLGKVFKTIPLKGESQEIYECVQALDVVPRFLDLEDIDLDIEIMNLLETTEIIKNLETFDNFCEENNFKEVRMKELSKGLFEDYKDFFKLFELFGSFIEKIFVVTKKNKVSSYKLLRVLFVHKERKLFSIDFPFIDKDGNFKMGNNCWNFAYKMDVKHYLKEKEIMLLHPYQWLCQKLLNKAQSLDEQEELYTQDFYEQLIANSWGEANQFFNRKLLKILRNAKNPWEKEESTPIMWIDPQTSSVGKELLSRNILIDSNYSELSKVGLIKGLDLLSGSTSTPAKRVITSENYELVRRGSKIILEQKEQGENIKNFVGVYKCSYPAFVFTSAKRDNTSTIKDTVNLLEENQYQRRFILK